ncbi:MAG: Glyoxalase/Bleomycin resistance protein/Dioxygenase superfamily [Acidimicrobiaceae bacterium]|jgi:catechol 2,3-dioxygenase-like lactoylglutathione lyase family enzyme
MATITGAHHIALTVTDVERSAQWYQELLGMQVVLQGDDETVRYRVLAHPSGWIMGLRQYPGKEVEPSTSFGPGSTMSHSR